MSVVKGYTGERLALTLMYHQGNGFTETSAGSRGVLTPAEECRPHV